MSTTTHEEQMVVIQRAPDGTPTVWCDPDVVDLVTALNQAGIRTTDSCSGHGFRPGFIGLADGRRLVIARSLDEQHEIDALFPLDIQGRTREEREDELAQMLGGLP